MAIDYRTPADIAEEYLTNLKTLRPDVNTKQTDTDWWIRAQVVGGVISGIYADQAKIADDIFPQSSRYEALEKHLITRTGAGYIQATQAIGKVLVTGASGSIVPANTQVTYLPNSNVYAFDLDVRIDAPSGVLADVTSVSKGYSQNLLAGAELKFSVPPSGVNDICVVYAGNISDGRDNETKEEAVKRLLAIIQEPNAGGTESDYKQFAIAADSSVISANVIRWVAGLGTVGVIITAGTSDVDGAIDAGLPVVITPSPELIAKVQAYISTVNPLTDVAYVMAPEEVPLDITVYVRFYSGNQNTLVQGLGVTQGEMVKREVRRAIYKTPVGGTILGASGYMVASDIEENIDVNLNFTSGLKTNIVVDRQCYNLDGVFRNKALTKYQVPSPGTITIVES